MLGKGKYDDACSQARAETKADGVILIVLNGEKGTGMSVQLPGWAVEQIPHVIRQVADEIERDFKRAIEQGNLNG